MFEDDDFNPPDDWDEGGLYIDVITEYALLLLHYDDRVDYAHRRYEDLDMRVDMHLYPAFFTVPVGAILPR